jgi:hypothetical protein
MGMKDHRLIERLREADPATPERLAAASYDAVEMRRRILSQGVDELAVRRRVRRHRVGVVAAAAFVTAALLVPLILLLPLGGDANRVGGGVSPTVSPTESPTESPTTTTSPSFEPVPTEEPGGGRPDPIEVTEPIRGTTVTSPVTITGTADVFEATVSIRILDETGNVIADTFTTATCGTGCRGDYSERVKFTVDREQPGTIEVFEVSAKDGSMINVVRIPVTLVPRSS